MSKPSTLEEEVEATIRAWLQTWTEPGLDAVEGTAAFIAEDFSGIGTGPGDHYGEHGRCRRHLHRSAASGLRPRERTRTRSHELARGAQAPCS